MPRTGRPTNTLGLPPGRSELRPDEDGDTAELDTLVGHCLAAHAIIELRGTSAMRRLIDLLLFEIGSEFSEGIAYQRASSGRN